MKKIEKRKFDLRLLGPSRSGNIIGIGISDTLFIMLHVPHEHRNYFHLQIDVKIVKKQTTIARIPLMVVTKKMAELISKMMKGWFK